MSSEIPSGMFYLRDARNGSLHGPYSEKDAEVAADRMNHFVMPAVFKAMGAKAVGPFFPVALEKIPSYQKKELTRLYNS